MYDLGDVVVLAVTVRDADGDPADTDAVTCTITAPDGVSALVPVTHGDTGQYSASFTPTLPGWHVARWLATGVNPAAHADVFTVADPAATPMVSLDDAKAHLNITSTASDDELRRMLAAAQDVGETHTGRVFARRTVVETRDSPAAAGGLLLTRVPVQSVTTVTVDGTTLAAADYRVDPAGGVVHHRSGSWPGEQVTVTYVAGPASPHGADVQGVLEMLRHLWTTQRGSIPAYPRGQEWDPASGYSLPRRVAELWDLRPVAGFA